MPHNRFSSPSPPRPWCLKEVRSSGGEWAYGRSALDHLGHPVRLPEEEELGGGLSRRDEPLGAEGGGPDGVAVLHRVPRVVEAADALSLKEEEAVLGAVDARAGEAGAGLEGEEGHGHVEAGLVGEEGLDAGVGIAW